MDYSYYSAQQAQPQQPFNLYSLHGLPTPDQNQNHNPHTDDLQDSFANNYNNQNYQFDPSFRIDPNASFVPPPHSPPDSFSKHSISSNDNANQGEGVLNEEEQRSDSEEKEGAAPAQSKRKAQNRAAQRAFRERKERHVKELQQKVDQLEHDSNRLHADNERLKQQLARFSTENEILRATSNSFNPTQNNSAPEPTTGPMEYSPTDFYSKLNPEDAANSRHRITVCEKTGERLYDTGATWDFIQGHEIFKRGLVDIADVVEKLKGVAQCDGQGPAFREGEIRKAIEKSAEGGNDELI